MIHIERARLPAGTRAFAYREDGVIVVQVSAELSARKRLAAIRQALHAAPAAGWRSRRSPVLLAALAGCVGLRRAPESRWAHRVLVTAAVALAVLIAVATLTSVSLNGTGRQPAALQPGRPPLLAGPGPAPGQPATGHGPSASRQPGNRAGSPPGQRGSAPGSAPKSGKKNTTTSAGGPAPQGSGTSAPTASQSPRPGQTPSTSPSPSPSPSPAKQSGGSGSCVGLLVIRICL